MLLRVARLIILPSAPASLSVLGESTGLRPAGKQEGGGGQIVAEQMRQRDNKKTKDLGGTQVVNCGTKM